MTADDLIQLVDRQQIEALLIDYCALLDRMELSELAALFTTDCQVVYGPGPALTSDGRDGLEASLARMWRWSRTAHHLCNLRIRYIDPDVADTESQVIAWHEASDGRTATLYGRYLDRVVRTSYGWRIAQRRMDMNGSDAGFRVPLPPAPRRPTPSGWRAPDGLD